MGVMGFFQDICQAIEEGVTVLVILEDLSSFYPPSHYVLKESGGVKSGLAGHSFIRQDSQNDQEVLSAERLSASVQFSSNSPGTRSKISRMVSLLYSRAISFRTIRISTKSSADSMIPRFSGSGSNL